MYIKKKLKLTLLILCSAVLLSCGCSPARITSNKINIELTEDEKAFDELSHEIFESHVNNSTLTLNHTLKEPSKYDIELDEITWGDIPLTEEDFADEKDQTKDFLHRLNNISGLFGERALTYDIAKYYLEADLESYNYIYFTSNFEPMIGFQSQFPFTMSEYHFDDSEDVEEYLTLLETFRDYVKEMLQFENQKAAAGYGMCKSALEQAIIECHSFCDSVENNLLIEVFPENLKNVHISDAKKEAYIERNKEAIINSVIPAYTDIINTLTAQLETAPENGNLASYSGGQDYYRYLLRSSVGTDHTPEELIQQLEERLNSDILSLSSIMISSPDIFDKVADAQYSLTDPTQILEHFKTTLTAEQFPKAPDAEYTLKQVHPSMSANLSPAMYLIPRIDDISNNQIYLNIIQENNPNSGNALMPTIAHEGYPGHMYQMTYYYSTDPDPLRTILACDGYVEGWASYAESLSYDYCGFSEDVADFYRISNLTMALNLYCRLDLGIHYENWDINQVTEFISRYLVLDEATVREIYNSILFKPTNYLIYGVGMNEILDMREDMEKDMDENFNVKEFHKRLLDLGPAPFPIVRKYITDSAVLDRKLSLN